MHAIEKIEVSLKTKVAYILGKNYKAYGYLNFSSWCNREEYCKYYLKEKIRLSSSHDIKDKKNLNANGFPTIWLTVDVLTFGDILVLLQLMSKNNLRKLASYYGYTAEELMSWL
ncbi:hypothetical protein IGJ55_001913 [Enterococcus sp. AZ170]